MGRRQNRITIRRGVGVFTAAVGGALLALAGHLELLRRFGTVLPYRDQWRLTAIDLLQPFYEGRLGWREFFEPLNDHWPVLTRLFSFALLRVNGQWNNLVETSLNALLFAGIVGVFLYRILPAVTPWARPAIAAVGGIVFALPITWENTLWGIQSLVYLQIAFTIIYLSAVSRTRSFSMHWWAGHISGVAVLLTQHSSILAHVAAALLLGWRLWRKDGNRRVTITSLVFAVAAILSFALFFPSITTTAALRADSWELALDVTLRQLAWPLPHPAWAFLMYLPWIAWAVDRFRGRHIAAGDSFILVCGLWVGGQAVAIGYGRAVDTHTFASRYCDFLALGVILNAACLARLWTQFPRLAMRLPLLVVAAAWVAMPVKSFWLESTQSHAGYNLERRPGENSRNLTRLDSYFATRDPAVLLDDPRTQFELYTYPPAMIPLLKEASFQAILPPETGSPLARRDHGRLGWISAVLLPSGLWLGGAGVLLLGVAVWRTWRKPAPSSSIATYTLLPRPREIAYGATALFIVSALTWRAWENPTVFDASARLNSAFAPLVEGVTYSDLEFIQDDGGMQNIVSARGSVETQPLAARPFWYGTRLKMKPDFRGVLRSEPFVVKHRYITVPFTGYPCYPGNGLRVRFVDPETKAESWESYVGNDPGANWNLWAIDAAAHQGAEAAIFLYDGHDGETGWLGVARPAQIDEPGFSARWRASLRLERAEATHRTIAGITLAAGLVAIAFWFWLLIQHPWRKAPPGDENGTASRPGPRLFGRS